MTTVSDAQLGAKLPAKRGSRLARIEALALAQRWKAYCSTTPGEQGSVAGSMVALPPRLAAAWLARLDLASALANDSIAGR